MSLSDTQFEFLKDVALLIQFVSARGWKLTGGELHRTLDQQKIYVKQGKSQTMKSKHLNRLAVDFNFFKPNGDLTYKREDVQWIGDFWESLHKDNEWGGNWESLVDTPHFQRNQ